jgi:predicted RNA-binding protein YlqC (UPF0109 family)
MSNEVHYRLILSIQSGTERGNGTMIKDLIADIVKTLVDQPEQVTVTEIETGHTVILEISVAKSDMGKVIGKQGRNAQAIRTILSAAAGKAKKRYVLEIVE